MMFLLLLLVVLQDQGRSEINPADAPGLEEVKRLVEAEASSPEYNQTEYPIAWTLTAAMVLLGMLAVCIPRFRKQHFVEPETPADKKAVKRR